MQENVKEVKLSHVKQTSIDKRDLE